VKGYMALHGPTGGSASKILGPREREVLQLLAEGHSSKVIADHLDISKRTVEAHRRNIMGKLNLHSIADLTKYAVREGLTALDK
jgi:DNA-binding NarL/FixJ family response regulator